MKPFIKTMFYCATALSLASCGGGGGDSSSPTATAPAATTTTTENTGAITTTPESPVSYQPDSAKLGQKAENTNELYVEQDFEFNTYKVITVDVQAVDEQGQALANTLLFISALPADVSELDDQLMSQKSLLGVFKTNSAGTIYQQIEVSSKVSNTLLELNTMGIENEVILPLEKNLTLQHQFK